MIDLTQFAGHTPGKWRWMNENTLVGNHGHRPVIVTTCKGKLAERKPDGFLDAIDPNGPNGRLLASGPELMEEVEQLREALGEMRKQVEKLVFQVATEAELLSQYTHLVPVKQTLQRRVQDARENAATIYEGVIN